MSLPRLTPQKISFRRLSTNLTGAACLVVAISLGAGAVAAAESQTGKKANSANRSQAKPFVPKPIEPLLSRDELRVCMAQQKRNRELSGEVTRMQAEVLAEKTELIRGSEVLKSELAALDRSKVDAVNAYNERTAARVQQVAEFEKKVAEFNANVVAFDTGRASYGRDCENRKFDEKDEKALLKEH